MADAESDTPDAGNAQPGQSDTQEVKLGCKDALLARTDQLIAHIRPDARSIRRRLCIATYVADLIMKCFQNDVPGNSVKAFMFGSVPLRTFLPDGDIDLSIFCEASSLRDTWATQLQVVLETEQKNGKSPFKIGDVVVINAEVKLLKCIVDNIVVDISYNQLGGLCTLNFLEKIDIMIQEEHLFKRSIMLVKAWCYYESRVLGAHHGLISTYALETLVLYIFNAHHRILNSPLEVLHKFLVEFSEFDWDRKCLTLQGPMPIDVINQPTRAPDPRIKDPLLSEDYTQQILQEYGHQQLSANRQEDKKFPAKCLNILDPLLPTNNLGRSVAKASFSRIRRAFHHAAQVLEGIFEKEDDVAAVKALDAFFKKTWEAQRRRLPQLIPNSEQQSNIDAISAAAAALSAAVAATSAVETPMISQSAPAYHPASRPSQPEPASMPLPTPQSAAAVSASLPTSVAVPMSASMPTHLPSAVLLTTAQVPPGRSMSPQIPGVGAQQRTTTPPPTSLPLHPMHMPVPAFGRMPIEATFNHGMMLPGQQPPPPPPARVATPPPYLHPGAGDVPPIRAGMDQQLMDASAEHIQQIAHAAASIATNAPHLEAATFQHIQALASLAAAGGLRPPTASAAPAAAAAAVAGPATTSTNAPQASAAPPNRQHSHSPVLAPSQGWPALPHSAPYIPAPKPGPGAIVPLSSANAVPTSSGMPRVHSFDSIPNMNMLTLQMLGGSGPQGRVPPHFPGYMQPAKQQQDVTGHGPGSGTGRGLAGPALQAGAFAPNALPSSQAVPHVLADTSGRVAREAASSKQQPDSEQDPTGGNAAMVGPAAMGAKQRDVVTQVHSTPGLPLSTGPMYSDPLERDGHREREQVERDRDATGPKYQGVLSVASGHNVRRPAATHGSVDPAALQAATARVNAWQGGSGQPPASASSSPLSPNDWDSEEGPGLGRRQTCNPLDDMSTSMAMASIGDHPSGPTNHHNARLRHSMDPGTGGLRPREAPMLPPGLEPGVAKRMVHHRPSASHDDMYQLMQNAQMQNAQRQNAQIQNAQMQGHMQRGDGQGLPGGQKLMSAWPGMLPPGAMLLQPGHGAMMPMMPAHSMPPAETSSAASGGPPGRMGPQRRPEGQLPVPGMLSFGAIPIPPGHFPYGIAGPGLGPGDMQPGPGPGGFGPMLGGPHHGAHPGAPPASNGPHPIASMGPNPGMLPNPVMSTSAAMVVPQSAPSATQESTQPAHHILGPLGGSRPAAASLEPGALSSEPIPPPLNAGALNMIASILQTTGNPDWHTNYQHMCMILSQLPNPNLPTPMQPGHPGARLPIPNAQAIAAAVLSAMAYPHPPAPTHPSILQPTIGKGPPAPPARSTPTHPQDNPHPCNAPPLPQAPTQPPPFPRQGGSFPISNTSMPLPHTTSQLAHPPMTHAMAQMQIMSAFAKMGYGGAGPDLFGMSPPNVHMSHLPPIPAPAAAPVHHSPPSWLPMHALELHHHHLQARRSGGSGDLMSADLDSLQQEFTTAKSAIMKSQTRRPSTSELTAHDRQPESHSAGPSSQALSKPASDVDDAAGSDSWLDDTFRMSAGDVSPKMSSDHSRLDSGSDFTHADAGSHAGSDSMMPSMLPPPTIPSLPLASLMPGPHPGSLHGDAIPPHPPNMMPFPPVPPFPVASHPPHQPEPHIPMPSLQDNFPDNSIMLPMGYNHSHSRHPQHPPMTKPLATDIEDDARSRDTPTSASSSDHMHSTRHGSPPSRSMHRDGDGRGHSSGSKDGGPPLRRGSSGRELPEYGSWDRERDRDREPPGINALGDSGMDRWDGRPGSSRVDPPGIHLVRDPPSTSGPYSHSRHSSLSLTPVRVHSGDAPERTTPSPGTTDLASRSSSSLSGDIDMPPGLAAPAVGPPGLGRSTPSSESITSPPSTGDRTPKLSRSGSEGLKAAPGAKRLFMNAVKEASRPTKSTPSSGGKHMPAAGVKTEPPPTSTAMPALIPVATHLSPGHLQPKQVS